MLDLLFLQLQYFAGILLLKAINFCQICQCKEYPHDTPKKDIGMIQRDQTLRLSLKEFNHNYFWLLKMHHRQLKVLLNLLHQMTLQHEGKCNLKSQEYQHLCLFIIIFGHIQESPSSWYRIYVLIDLPLVRKLHYGGQYDLFCTANTYLLPYSLINIEQCLDDLSNKT